MTNPKRIPIPAGELSRWLEIDEYARRRGITAVAAIIELVNRALSNGALVDLRRGEYLVGGEFDAAVTDYDVVVDSEVVDADPAYTFTDGDEAAAMRLGRIVAALPYAGNLSAPLPLIENHPSQFMHDLGTWLITYGGVVFGRAVR